MSTMKKRFCIMFIVMLFFILCSAFFCRYVFAENDTKSITGEINGIDWVEGKIVVRTYYNGNYDEMTFDIDKNTTINKGLGNISLADMNLSDKVTVQYTGDLAGLQALHVTVKT